MVESAGGSGSISSGGYSTKISLAKPAKNQDQELNEKISPDKIRKLNSRDLNKLLKNYINLLTQKQFAAITTAQIKTIDIEVIPKIPSNLMTSKQIGALEWWQVQELTDGQITSMTDIQIKSFVVGQSEGLAKMLLKEDIPVSDGNIFLNKLNKDVYAKVIKSLNELRSKLPLSR